MQDTIAWTCATDQTLRGGRMQHVGPMEMGPAISIYAGPMYITCNDKRVIQSLLPVMSN